MKLLVLALSLAACRPPVATTKRLDIPTDSSATCSTQCKSLGLDLTSVVIMANNVGCVCGVPATAPAPQASAGAAGGMTAILLQQQAAAAQQPVAAPAVR